jgi:L-ascorbate metabolism protein UlaG (beta-lactamase superfamily)
MSRSRGSGALTVRMVGGPTAVLEMGGLRFLTDPTFSSAGVHESVPGRPLTKTEGPAVSVAEIGRVDAVLLSHDQHADNLDPAGRDLVAHAPLTLTTESGATRLGGTARELPTWSSVVLDRPDGGSLQITAVPARHGPRGCEPLTGEVTGFVLAGRGLATVYVSGDNASLAAVDEVRSRFGVVDVALLFAGAARTSLFECAPLTLTSAGAAAAAHALAARWIVPMHIRGWAHFSEGPDEIRRAFSDALLTERLCIVEPGAAVTLDPDAWDVPTATNGEVRDPAYAKSHPRA